MKDKNTLDLKEVWRTIVAKRKTYYKVLVIVLALAALWIFPQPRYYKCTVKLAPESSEQSTMSSVSSIASSFGINLGGQSTADAIYPELYPDVMKSTDFTLMLAQVRVKSLKGDIDTTYFNYLQKHQKISFWQMPLRAARRLRKKLFPPEVVKNPNATQGQLDPFWLSRDERAMLELVAANVACSVDKKNEVISITVTDQDKLICACMADSASALLQKYITDYRTNKARVDVEYFRRISDEAREAYEQVCRQYAAYTDSHRNPVLNTVNVRSMELENDMQTKYQEYTSLQLQLHSAESKLQECTPAFMTLERASIPVKPAGPKRMLFCLGMLVLGFVGTTLYILRKEIFGA